MLDGCFVGSFVRWIVRSFVGSLFCMMLAGWFVGWLVGWLVGWFDSWLVRWLVRLFVRLFVRSLVCFSVRSLFLVFFQVPRRPRYIFKIQYLASRTIHTLVVTVYLAGSSSLLAIPQPDGVHQGRLPVQLV